MNLNFSNCDHYNDEFRNSSIKNVINTNITKLQQVVLIILMYHLKPSTLVITLYLCSNVHSTSTIISEHQ